MHRPVLMDSHSCFSDFTEAVPDDTIIWRYTSAQRLCELIQHRRLTLSSLTSMDDTSEGCLPEGQRHAVHRELPFALASFDRVASVYARWIFVSCWTEAKEESAEHWRSYGPNGCDVVIASTVGRLRKATTHARKYLISRMTYVSQQENYLLSNNNGGDLVGPALWKGKERFEWEREIRLVAVAQPPEPNRLESYANTFPPPRFAIPLDPTELVHEVRVNRRVTSDQFQGISKVVANMCSADVPVTYARVLPA